MSGTRDRALASAEIPWASVRQADPYALAQASLEAWRELHWAALGGARCCRLALTPDSVEVAIGDAPFSDRSLTLPNALRAARSLLCCTVTVLLVQMCMQHGADVGRADYDEMFRMIDLDADDPDPLEDADWEGPDNA